MEISQLENNSIYMTLETRGTPGTFHWGVFILSIAPSGQYYHATTKFGGWQLESKAINPMDSLSLILLYKIGTVFSISQIDQVLRDLPADGSASVRTGEAFTCRIWVKDALMALETCGLITLKAGIDILEKEAAAEAFRLEPAVEQGLSKVTVIKSCSSS